jgi:hypothetical protein
MKDAHSIWVHCSMIRFGRGMNSAYSTCGAWFANVSDCKQLHERKMLTRGPHAVLYGSV